LKIETQPEENRTLTVTVEVEDERVQPALRAAARRISKDYRIPGFRPGKAPYEVVLRHYGETALYQAALEDLSQKVYQDMLEQEKISPIGPGEMDIVELKPMKLKFVVPLRPQVELGDYGSLRVEYTPPVVEDAEVEKELEHLREHQAVLEPVDRPAQMGDAVTLDAKAFLNDGENPSDFLLADQDVALVLEEKADWPMPGFAAKAVGMTAGEERKFDLAFPDDYANESLRSQTAHFEVKAKEVKSRSLPEWNDELAKSLGDYETLDELRASVRRDLEEASRRGVDRDYNQKVVDQLVEQSSVKYPPTLLESELDDYIKDYDRRLREQKLTLEDYLKIEKKTQEEFREEVRPQAEARLKRSLVIGKVVEREHVTVDPAAVDERIESLSTPWGERADDMRKLLSTPESREMMELDLLTEAGIERLASIARGEVQAQPAPEPQPEPETQPAAQDQAAPAATAQADEAATSEGMPTPQTAEASAHDEAATAEAMTAAAEAASAELSQPAEPSTENNPPAAPAETASETAS
jgi:trigger factor